LPLPAFIIDAMFMQYVKGLTMKTRKLILIIDCILAAVCLQGCEPTPTHEETVTITPSQLNTLNETATEGDVCRGGTAPDNPGPGQIIVGFFHSLTDNGCVVNQIYEGLVRFQIDAAPFNRRLIKSATLTMNSPQSVTHPPRSSCIDKIGITDISWWSQPGTGRLHVGDIRNLHSVFLPTQPVSIDVTQEVQRWANGTEQNNGFVLIGQRPEMSDFSDTGMLTNETCESFYGDIALNVTFYQFNKPVTSPSISVSAVHTQTTSDITVNGTGFTPLAPVHIFADGLQGRSGSYPMGNVTTDNNGKFQYFYRELCTKQPDSATVRALDDTSGNNARGYASVFCY
jgi:hypothetical protein